MIDKNASKIVALLIAAGATLGAVAPATAQERHLKEFTPQFSAPSAHDELKHPAPRDLTNPPAALQGTKTTQFTDRTQLEYRSWGRVLKTWKFAK